MEGEFSSVSTPELVEQITTLAGHLNAGQRAVPGADRGVGSQARLGRVGREVLCALAQLEVRD